jgi:signal transduction histidine kinase
MDLVLLKKDSFDFFEQSGVKVTRQFGGLGLGLAICKALVELHRGSIFAESAGPGLGTAFIVELPAEAMDTIGKSRH